MPSVFGDAYARSYDALYASKDYRAESDFVEKELRRHSRTAPKKILDLGCGTGGHAVLLGQRGYAVTGIDRSPEMLAAAKERAVKADVKLVLERGDLAEFRLGEQFDGAISMFAVMSYLRTTAEFRAALENIRRHLLPGAPFAFDLWYGPAVVRQGVETRFREVKDGADRVLRIARSDLDLAAQTVTIHYHLLRLRDDLLLSETHESHTMRFHFPQELAENLRSTGFELVSLAPFMDPHRTPGHEDWSVSVLARAC